MKKKQVGKNFRLFLCGVSSIKINDNIEITK